MGAICQDLLTDACYYQDGVSLGMDTECAPNPCDAQQACCYLEGCADLEPYDCAGWEGVLQGSGTECGTTTCRPPEACCFLNGSCIEELPIACGRILGAPQGPGTACATSDCSWGYFRLECPEWYIDLDPSGFSDVWYLKVVSGWHCASYLHEVLSGEWVGAIYYDGVANSHADPTAPEGSAVWLTPYVRYPSWTSDSSFREVSRKAWDNAENPADGAAGTSDTARTVLTNGQVNIQIDFEIADLGRVFASPLGTAADPGGGAFALSERYVLLQTYTIMNISGVPLTNLELYQMLHSHPGDEYGPVVTSVYDSSPYPDPLLEAYVPFNPVHTVGNFRYDTTQWNNPKLPQAENWWIDWIGFGSTAQPSAIGNSFYVGRTGKPGKPGTHWDVEARSLNQDTMVGPGEIAGAQMWELGTLEAGGSTALTVVLMAGQTDCNENDVADLCDIADGTSLDCNETGIADECEGVIFGDFDADGRTTLLDWDVAAAGLAGPGQMPFPQTPECLKTYLDVFDSDGDGDLDLGDFATFQSVFNGAPH